MYKIKFIYLEHCPYSQNSKSILDNNNIPYLFVKVNQTNKHKYKNNNIQTFPQIYIIKNNNQILLGGNSDLQNIINIIKNDNLDIIKKELSLLYPQFDNKTILRIIEIFIKKN